MDTGALQSLSLSDHVLGNSSTPSAYNICKGLDQCSSNSFSSSYYLDLFSLRWGCKSFPPRSFRVFRANLLTSLASSFTLESSDAHRPLPIISRPQKVDLKSLYLWGYCICFAVPEIQLVSSTWGKSRWNCWRECGTVLWIHLEQWKRGFIFIAVGVFLIGEPFKLGWVCPLLDKTICSLSVTLAECHQPTLDGFRWI